MRSPNRKLCATLAAGILGLLFTLIPAGPGALAATERVLNIYSHRQPFLIRPFIDAYTERTGTEVNIVYASKGLAQRLEAEGAGSPADLVLTVDIARLRVYADKDLLAPVESEILRRNIPAHLRDPGNRWFAFSKRARVIAVSVAAEGAAEGVDRIARYEDLADPAWRGRICTRPGSHVYNRALVASFIHHRGAAAAEAWVRGLVGNLARRPQGNDRAQVKAIHQGVCDLAIINHYYLGKLQQSDKAAQRRWAASVRAVFPNQGGRGTHINISGGGVARHAKHREEAVRFLEFLSSPEAQALYGAANFEYPVNPQTVLPAELSAWGAFAEDRMPVGRLGDLAPEAQKVIDRAQW